MTSQPKKYVETPERAINLFRKKTCGKGSCDEALADNDTPARRGRHKNGVDKAMRQAEMP